MADQRNRLLPALVTLVALSLPLSLWAAAPDIVPPEPFALELPAGVTTLGAEDEPLRRLAALVHAGEHRVTIGLPRERVGAGLWRVILSAWGPDKDRKSVV